MGYLGEGIHRYDSYEMAMSHVPIPIDGDVWGGCHEVV